MITAGFVVLLVPAATYLLAVPQLYAGFSARYGGANVDVLHDPRAMFEWTRWRSAGRSIKASSSGVFCSKKPRPT